MHSSDTFISVQTMSSKRKAVDAAVPSTEQAPLLASAMPAGPSYHPRLYDRSALDPQTLRYADARARTRVVKAIALGFALYIACGLAMGFGFVGGDTRWRRGKFRLRPPTWPGRPDPAPSDGHPLQCGSFSGDFETWQKSANASRAVFEVPVGVDEGFFLSARGSLAKGKVTFVVAEAESEERRPKAHIEISARYDDHRLIDLATVCTLERKSTHGDVERGLGLYTSQADLPSASSHLNFDIVVTLPFHSLDSLTVHANAMEIAGSLASAPIRRVQLISQDARIALERVQAADMRITTTNGSIDGHFLVHDQLVLCTTNGAINARVAVSDAKGNQTVVSATSSNGAVRLDYVEQPRGHKLLSHVSTSNGAAYVSMHPQYEGDYEVRFSWFHVELA